MDPNIEAKLGVASDLIPPSSGSGGVLRTPVA